MYYLDERVQFPLTPKSRWLNNLEVIKFITTGNGLRPSPEILDRMATYCGMGTIAGVFTPRQKWEIKAKEQLEFLLDQKQYAAAKSSILNAYYTPPQVARIMWKILQRLGFHGGNALSLSAGTGMFTMTQPEGMENSWTLIEQDDITAGVLRHLYKEATIFHRGFHKTRIPDGTYDLFIDNVPFGDYRLADLSMNNSYRVHSHALFGASERYAQVVWPL